MFFIPEETNIRGETRNFFRKIGDNQGNISCKDGHDKGQKWYGPNKQKRKRRGGKITQNYLKKISMIQITMMVWSLT